MRFFVAFITVAFAGLAMSPLLAEWRWRNDSDKMIRATRRADGVVDEPINERDLADLPMPVAAYFRRALRVGHDVPSSVRLEQFGQMLINDRWRQFSAVEHFSIRPRSFVWDARIRMAPLVYTLVRDAYLDGTASMRVSLAGVFGVADDRGGEALNTGALHRYLAEATWMPAALLPRFGVIWTSIDETHATATMSDSGTTVSLEFTFNEAGEVTRIFTPSRYRAVNGHFEPTPWEGRFENYAERCGMWIPLEAEVSWQIAGHWQPWWRGRIASVDPM